MVGGRLSHRGEDCSFETFLKEYDLLGNPVLSEIAEIVHDADLMDEKYARPESDAWMQSCGACNSRSPTT